jgi:hypothetical protein
MPKEPQGNLQATTIYSNTEFRRLSTLNIVFGPPPVIRESWHAKLRRWSKRPVYEDAENEDHSFAQSSETVSVWRELAGVPIENGRRLDANSTGLAASS